MKVLEDFERIRLGVFPTPLQKLNNISKKLHTNVWIKRDDLTGVGLGGNKVRKLEYLLADAKQKGARIVFTTGEAQSNHAMLTAACCRMLGMEPILILKNSGVKGKKGNQLLESLMDVDVQFMDVESYDEIYAEMERVGKESGKKYYVIPCGGSNGIGSLGYIDCVREISYQQKNLGVNFDYIIGAEGSGGTIAGLNVGQILYLPKTRVIGAKVSNDNYEEITPNIMRESLKLLESDISVKNEDILHINAYGPGYAIPSEEGTDAIKWVARMEGLFLDPVYTGKAFGALLRMAQNGAFKPDDNVLFMHTGGTGGLFAIDFE